MGASQRKHQVGLAEDENVKIEGEEQKGTELKEFQRILRQKLCLRKTHPFKTFVCYKFGNHQKSIDEAVRDGDPNLIPDKEWEHVQLVAKLTSAQKTKPGADSMLVQGEGDEIPEDPEHTEKNNNMLVATWVEDPVNLRNENAVSNSKDYCNDYLGETSVL